MLSPIELPHLISLYGYAAVAGIVALESLGIPLPGETALIAAAVVAGSAGDMNIWLLIAAASAGAIVGDNIGFLIGRKLGFWLLVRYGHYAGIREKRIKLVRYLFLRYGGAVVFFGRFVAVLRAWAAILAGTGGMSWPRFLLFNAAGGIVWAFLYGLGGYYLGREVSRVAQPAAAAVAILAILAIAGMAIFVHRRERELTERAEAAFPGPLVQRRDHNAHNS